MKGKCHIARTGVNNKEGEEMGKKQREFSSHAQPLFSVDINHCVCVWAVIISNHHHYCPYLQPHPKSSLLFSGPCIIQLVVLLIIMVAEKCYKNNEDQLTSTIIPYQVNYFLLCNKSRNLGKNTSIVGKMGMKLLLFHNE